MDFERVKWRNLMGDFMLDFAEIEVLVLGIVEDFGPDDLYAKARRKLFAERLECAKSAVREAIQDQELREQIERELVEIGRLASDVRNLIAHNPLQLALESILNAKRDLEVRSFRRCEEVISFEQLQQEHINLQSADGRLSKLLFRARKQQGI